MTAPNERIYQLSYAEQRDSGPRFKVYVKFIHSDITVLYNISVLYVSLHECNQYNYLENEAEGDSDPDAQSGLREASGFNFVNTKIYSWGTVR